MTVQQRVLLRRPQAESELVDELVKTTQDRLLLRAGIFLTDEEAFPSALESIVVDVTVKAYTRHEVEHEGMESEGVDGMSLSFVDDLLAEYDRELAHFAANRRKAAGAVEKVRFL